MAGSILVAVKRKVTTDLAALPALTNEGVSVEYAYNAKVTNRDRVFLGRGRAIHDPASLKSGRTFRNERMSFDLIAVTELVGGTAEDAEARVVNTLGLVVEEYFADNRTLGGAVAGLNWVVVSGFEVVSLFNDRGHLAEATYEITYDARLT